MKRSILASIISAPILFVSLGVASELVTFEGLVPAPGTQTPIASPIPGVTFAEDVYVVDPAEIGNSPGQSLSAATSGSAAATTTGTTIHFEHPVMQLAVNVSPSFIALNGVSGFVRVDLIGFDREGSERARTIILLRASAATLAEVETFEPQTIEIQSHVPLAYAALRFDIGRIFFDDLTFTPASDKELAARLPPAPRWQPGSFEGLVKSWQPYAPLTDQIQGLLFIDEFYVMDPPYIGNSTSIPLSGATSGNAAASTFGGTIHFREPVREVSAYVSPGNISLNGVSSFAAVELIGFDADSRERARAVVSIRVSAETAEQVAAFQPEKIGLVSKTPLSCVTVSPNTGRIYLDDLAWKPARSKRPIK